MKLLLNSIFLLTLLLQSTSVFARGYNDYILDRYEYEIEVAPVEIIDPVYKEKIEIIDPVYKEIIGGVPVEIIDPIYKEGIADDLVSVIDPVYTMSENQLIEIKGSVHILVQDEEMNSLEESSFRLGFGLEAVAVIDPVYTKGEDGNWYVVIDPVYLILDHSREVSIIDPSHDESIEILVQ